MREEVDDLLAEYLHRELDAHAGKLAPAVEASIRRRQRGEASSAAGGRLLVWAVWSAGAIAASVGIVWGVTRQQDSRPGPAVALDQPETSTGILPVPIAKVVQSATSDEGTVFLPDGGPARRVRQRTVETTTFYDPLTHATLDVSVPEERVMLVGLHAY